MKNKQNIQPWGWAKAQGYANGIVGEGKMLFVAGQVGWDPTSAKPVFPNDFESQFDNALANVVAVVRQAGGTPEDVARMTIFITDKAAYVAARKALGPLWKRHMGRSYPAMTLVEVKSLLEDQALVEIEATAVLSASS